MSTGTKKATYYAVYKEKAAKYDALVKDYNALLKKYNEVSEADSRNDDTVLNLENDLIEMNKEIEALQKSKNQIEKKYNDLLSSQSEKISIGKYNEQIKENQKLSSRLTDFDRLKKDYETLRKSLTMSKKSNSDISASLEIVTEKRDKLKEENETLKNNLDILKEVKKSLDKEIADLKEKSFLKFAQSSDAFVIVLLCLVLIQIPIDAFAMFSGLPSEMPFLLKIALGTVFGLILEVATGLLIINNHRLKIAIYFAGFSAVATFVLCLFGFQDAIIKGNIFERIVYVVLSAIIPVLSVAFAMLVEKMK